MLIALFHRLKRRLARRVPTRLHLSHRRGLSAEAHAERHVRSLGWRILGRRIRTSTGSDIDLLAVDGRDLVFIEVRSRQQHALLSAKASIRHDKQRMLLANVRALCRKRRFKTLRPRIDVIAIDLEGDHVRHLSLLRNCIPCHALHPD